MIIALLSGIIIGLALAIPPGPISVTAIKLGLFSGKKQGTSLAMGTGLMDFIYCVIAIFATSAAISALDSFSLTYPHLILIIQLIIVIAFISFGFINLKNKPHAKEILEADVKETKLAQKLSSKGPFFLGIAVALANAPNPTFLPSLAWITMQVHQFKIFEGLALNNLFFAVGFGFGNFLWLYAIIRVIIKFRHRFSPQTLLRIRQFAGFTFIGFGTLLGYRVVTLTHWSDVLRIVFAF